MRAEVAVWACEIDAAPATTFPPVGSALTAGELVACANADDEMSAVLAEKMHAKVQAGIASAKNFFNKIFEERSDLSCRLLFTTLTRKFPEW
jgi:hypothetical protein